MLALTLRDVRRGYAGGGAALVVAFFLLVAVLFPFAIGPDAAVLARVGGGVIWAAALLAALLPVERLVGPDLESGVLDQLRVRGVSLALVATAKIVAHWVAFAPPLMLAAVIAAGLLDLSGATLVRVEIGLAIGTPGLAALAIGELLNQVFADLPGKVEAGELGVREETRGLTLPTAIWARWSRD